MTYPQIYIGSVPEHGHERRALRGRALDLRVRLRTVRDPSPLLVLLNAALPGVGGSAGMVLARPQTLIVANIRGWAQPIAVRSGEPWIDMQTGAQIQESCGRTPFQEVAMLRDGLRALALRALAPGSPEARVVERATGAVICMPTLHAESQIQLDVGDHRSRLKVLGMDELTGLASMAGSSLNVSESALHNLMALLGGRLWHDGNRLLFELAPPRYELALVRGEGTARTSMPLLEGENVIGRRRTARPHEYRITLASDDLISSDHALIVCHDDGRVMIRDVSKNGTWIIPPDGPEQHLHGQERALTPGTRLRMGVTELLLDSVSDAAPG
jgi:hypothetical protein